MMTLITTPKIIPCLLITLFLGLNACGSKEPEAASSPRLEEGIPKELSDAHLVYETDAGIFLQKIGKAPSLLVENGRWPRWSPDGSFVAFLKGDEVSLITLPGKKIRTLTKTSVPKTVVVSANGDEVWYSEGKKVKAVSLKTGEVRTLAEDGEFLEIDCGPDAKTLVATVKSFGYKVKVFDLTSGKGESLGKGCSASISPDGKYITNNLDGHRRLALLNPENGTQVKILHAPEELVTDNQFWSNHPNWVVSMEEDHGAVLAHRVSDGKVWKLFPGPGADRPDLWLP